ncbi:MAG: DUF3168 domain-containing protein [Pseudomonadota bacterium]
MSAAGWDVQRAVYAALRDDAAIRAVLGDPPRLYDDAPSSAPFPYLTIGEAQTRPLEGVDGAEEHTLRLYAFSRYAGRREVKAILAAVHDALHDAPLVLNDHHLVSLRYVFADAFRRQDRETYQGAIRFRAVTQSL